MIIGLSGYARSGKDEAASVLVEEFGFRRVAFADKLREVLYQLNPFVRLTPFTVIIGQENPPKRLSEPVNLPVRVQDVINHFGWDGYKETEYAGEIRSLLQKLGTEAGRLTLWDSIWVDAAFAGTKESENIVVTDCRFPNEAQAIVDRGGEIWRISRTGVGPANSHASETSLDEWPWERIILNDGSLEDFHRKIRKIMR